MTANRRPRRTFNSRLASRRRSGFTLLELMLVLAIIVALAAVVGFNLFGAQDDANAQTTVAQLQQVKASVSMYRIKVGKLPEKLEELVTGPSDAALKAKFGSPVMNEVPKDAWQREIVYTLNGNKFELRSAGIDGQMNSEDDLIVEG